jgi:hypothetical protein
MSTKLVLGKLEKSWYPLPRITAKFNGSDELLGIGINTSQLVR